MAKILKYGLLVVLLIFLILLLVPWLFKDDIFKRVQAEANNNLKGELVIEDLSLSLIRHFPNLSLGLSGLSYTNAAPFEGQQLFAIGEIRAKLDLMSVISGDQIKVKEIAIIDPTISAAILEDGAANYNIMKATEDVADVETNSDAQGEGSFNLGIDRFIIENMNVVFNDQQTGVYTAIENGQLKLSGNFSDQDVQMVVKSTMDAFTVAMGGTNYLNKVAVDANLDAAYNQASGKLTLGQNEVALNNLKLVFEGWVQSMEDAMDMDITFSAPNTEFKEVLSLIPAVYMNDYADVKTSGSFAISGNVTGQYGPEDADYPGFDLALNVNNGRFQYPDLPSSVENINVNTQISHQQGDLDKTVVDMKQASMNIANNPFSAKLLLKHPMSDPMVDASVKTTLNLNELTQVVPVEDVALHGIIYADAFVKGSMTQFEGGDYENVDAGGWMAFKGFNAQTTSFKKDVEIDTAYMSVSPQEFKLPVLQSRIGKSDFNGSGKLDNLLTYALHDDTLRGQFALHSAFIDVSELMNAMAEEEQQAENESVADTAAVGSASSEVPAIPGNLDLVLKMDADKVLYNDLNMEQVTGKLTIANAMAKLDRFEMDVLQGRLRMDGVYSTPENVPFVKANFEIKKMDAKSAFTGLNTVQTFAPVAQSTTGSFSTKFSYQGALNDDLSPNLASIKAKGNLYTLGLMVQPELMQTVAEILNNTNYEKIRFQDSDLGFEINDGRINISPAKLFVGDLKAEFSGSHGLDQTMDYHLKTNVPIDKIDLPKELKDLGLASGTIPVEFKIGGTLDKPTVKPVFGDAVGVKDLINNVIDNVVTKAKDSATDLVNAEAEKQIADAKKQADEMMRQAVEQAAQVKAEASKQADALKKEARKQADDLIKEAKGDVFKEAAAKIAADQLVKKADKQIDALEAKANTQADNVVNEARKQADAIIKEAEEKAKIKN